MRIVGGVLGGVDKLHEMGGSLGLAVDVDELGMKFRYGFFCRALGSFLLLGIETMGPGLGLLVFDAGFVQSRYSRFRRTHRFGLKILISCYLFLFPAGNLRRSPA